MLCLDAERARAALGMVMMMTKTHVGFVPKCRGCGGKFHELTENFRPVPPMRGDYLRMLKKHRNNGWYAFPERDWVIGDNVQCPQCGTPYSVASILRQLEALGADEQLSKREPVEPAAAVPPVAGTPVEDDAEPAREASGGGDEAGGLDDADDSGIYDTPLGGDGRVDSLSTRVMQMTRDGHTQTGIAETCQISVYMVRQIQNGKKV